MKIPFFSRGKMGSSVESGIKPCCVLGIKVVVMAQELPQSIVSTVSRYTSVELAIKLRSHVVIYDGAHFYAAEVIFLERRNPHAINVGVSFNARHSHRVSEI